MPTTYFNSSLKPAKSGVNLTPLNGQLVNGSLTVAVAEFTVPEGGAAIGDILNIMDLPQGALVLPSLSSFHGNGDASSAFTLKVGSTAITGAFAATAAASLAGSALVGGNFRLTAAATLTATLSAAALTAGKKFVFVIAYALLV